MPTATFVLSTGRCGTQWLATTLREVYGDEIAVRHEPIDDEYRSRERTPDEAWADLPGALREHIDRVDAIRADRPYVETGFPCWSSLPHLVDALDGAVQILHLTRPPVPTARSWVRRDAYRPPLLPHETERVLLAPTDPAARLDVGPARWAQMAPFEKALYFWAEVHAFGVDLFLDDAQSGVGADELPSLDVPWLRVSTEALFDGKGLERVRAFLDLPRRDGLLDWRTRRVDDFASGPAGPVDDRLVDAHPYVGVVAERLGVPAGRL